MTKSTATDPDGNSTKQLNCCHIVVCIVTVPLAHMLKPRSPPGGTIIKILENYGGACCLEEGDPEESGKPLVVSLLWSFLPLSSLCLLSEEDPPLSHVPANMAFLCIQGAEQPQIPETLGSI